MIRALRSLVSAPRLAVAIFVTTIAPTARAVDPAPAPSKVREASFGYSRTMLQGVNEADFRSAMLAYARVIAQNSHIPTRTDQPIFENVREMADALRLGSINLLTAPAREILSLPAELLEPAFVVSATENSTGVEFVLIVHRDRGLDQLDRLRHLTLSVWDSPPTSLAFEWLDLLLARADLGPPASFFSQIKHQPKPGPTVLPVYFGQVDAAIITRRAFALLAEMNPQLSRQLQIIASSPRIQPMLTGFRRGIDPDLRDKIVSAMFSIDSTAAGRQVLVLYQTESLAFCEPKVLAATRQLLVDHAQLVAPAEARPPTPPRSPVP